MPTLTQPAIGSTAWGTQMNTNLQVLQTQLTNAMQGRIQRDSATQVSLQRYTGDTVEVNGLNVSMGSSGLAFNALTTDTITSTGADSTSLVAASTLYYVYISNANATFLPSSLALSTTAYTSFNGVRYLGSSGNAANWRFVGWVRTNASSQFQDTPGKRFVINYYNRRVLALYQDTLESTGTWTYSGTAWRQANANSNNQVEFIANGEDACFLQVSAHASPGAAGSSAQIGVGVGSATVNSAKLWFPDGGTASYEFMIVSTYLDNPGEGYQVGYWIERQHGGSNAVTFIGTGGFFVGWVEQGGIVGSCMG